MNCIVDETIDLKDKFTRLTCKSLRRRSSPRFKAVSFSLVHSRERLWSITIFCLGRMKGREEERRLVFFCVSSRAAEKLLL